MGLEANIKMKQNLDEHPSHPPQYFGMDLMEIGIWKVYIIE